MAAVRCAARRLGESAMLQRTQAEERRRLVPSRLMHTKEEEFAREIRQKKEELYESMSKVERNCMSIQDKRLLRRLAVQVTPRPDFRWAWLWFSRRVISAVEIAAKISLIYVFASGVHGINDYLGDK